MNVYLILVVFVYFEFDEFLDGVMLKVFGDWVIVNLK